MKRFLNRVGGLVALGVATATSAFATVSYDYSPVQWNESTGVQFTPSNSVTPVIEGLATLFGVVFGLVILWKLGSMVIGFLSRRRA